MAMGKIKSVTNQNKKGVNYIESKTSRGYQTMDITFKEMLTPDDVKQRLFVGKSKVYEILRSGRLKSVRIGRQYRVSESALQSYIEEQKWEDYEINK